MFEFVGVLSGLIYIVGDIPYIKDVIKGRTKPQRISWALFFGLNVINLANQIALNAHSSLWLIYSWTLVTFIIFALSIKKGVGGKSRIDIICVSGAILGLILWALLKTPLASLYCNLLVGIIAFIPTIKKAYVSPGTETKISWLTATIAAVLSTISVGRGDSTLLLIPVCSAILSGTIFTILVVRGHKRA
ncbi:MAG TPA: hypothetical protein VIH90_05445 [Candidatus Saccharimonadales bacterium]